MEHWIDTLSDMALFVEVARAGSFRHAALRLSMPVSTLSRRVASLERRLGVPLLPQEPVVGWSLFALTATRAMPAQVRGLIAYVKEQLPARLETGLHLRT